MDSNADLKQPTSNNWKSVTDLFEGMFGDEASFSSINSTEQPLRDSVSDPNVQTTYITLEALDCTQESNNVLQIANIANDQTTEEIQHHNSGAYGVFQGASDRSSRNPDPIMSHAPVPLNPDETISQTISPTLHAPLRQLLQAGMTVIAFDISSRRIGIRIE